MYTADIKYFVTSPCLLFILFLEEMQWIIRSIFIPTQQRLRGYSNAAVCLWLGEWMSFVSLCMRGSVCPSRFNLWAECRLQFLSYHFQTSYASCSWWEEEPYWFWVKGQGQIWHFVYKTLWTRYRLVFAQWLSNFTCKLFMMRGGTLLILGHGSKVKVKFGTLYHLVDTIQTIIFFVITFKLTWKLFMMRGGTLLILGHGVKGQGQLWHSLFKDLSAQRRLLC